MKTIEKIWDEFIETVRIKRSVPSIWKGIFTKELKSGFLEITRYSCGMIVEQEDFKGRAQGPHLTYNGDGTLYRRYFYQDGKAEGLFESFHPSTGKPAARYWNKNDQRHGLFELWYPNGNKRSYSYYKNGKQEGIAEEYYENGQLHTRCGYKEGIKHGLEWIYSPEGVLLQKRCFVKERARVIKQLDEVNKLRPSDIRKEIKYQLVRDFRVVHQRG